MCWLAPFRLLILNCDARIFAAMTVHKVNSIVTFDLDDFRLPVPGFSVELMIPTLACRVPGLGEILSQQQSGREVRRKASAFR
jgi:hypothetical protein